jgi:UDP-glucose 4-epimerase
MKNKILVTGGTGYIGSHTIVQLIRTTDFEVISIDNHSRSFESTLDRIFEITGKRIKNYSIDLCDKKSVEKVFSENNDLVGVIHFAAYKSVNESVNNPVLYYHNNINSLLNIITTCEEFGVKHLIFSSSCSVYGNVDKLPVTEDTPLSKAESPYAHTKQIGEDILQSVTKKSKILKAISLRYFNPVGADISGKLGENSAEKPNNLVPVITQTAVGIIPQLVVHGGDYPTRDGSCIRDYVHVLDVADAHLKALDYLIQDKNKKPHEIYNLGIGNGVSVLEAIHSFEKISGVKLNYKVGERREGDVVSIYSDCSYAKERLGWKCQFGIDEMMRTAWEWQKLLAREKK